MDVLLPVAVHCFVSTSAGQVAGDVAVLGNATFTSRPFLILSVF
jgi:hypothetical protein